MVAKLALAAVCCGLMLGCSPGEKSEPLPVAKAVTPSVEEQRATDPSPLPDGLQRSSDRAARK